MPDRAMYRPGEEARVAVALANAGEGRCAGTLRLTLAHLDDEIARLERPVVLEADETAEVTFALTPPPVARRGYGLDATLLGSDGAVVAVGSGALDVLERWSQAPRYGFLAEFGPELSEADVDAACASLCRYHLNVVQFYDWMWRHYRLLPPTQEFTDALGRRLSLASVRRAIAGVQARGGAALAYGAVYGAEPEFADLHPEMVLLDEQGNRISLAELFFIMDIAPGSAWTPLIVEEFAETVRTLGFDGIHLDQYGFPQTAVTTAGARRDLAADFPPLIDAARAAVVRERSGAGVIFNAVGNWPIETVTRTTQDAVYVEVWPPDETYADLRRLIRNAKRLAPDKQVILAAYLTPFLEAPEAPESEAAARLATAVIAACGGFHLLLGERDGILCDPYYPKYATLRPAFAAVLRGYSDVLVRCQEWLTDPLLVDRDGVEPAGGVSLDPAPGAIWAIGRSRPGYRVVHAIDLRDQADLRWNAPRTPPGRSDAPVELSLADVPPVARVLACSPERDGGRPRCLEFGQDGDRLRLSLPSVDCWSTVICRLVDAAA